MPASFHAALKKNWLFSQLADVDVARIARLARPRHVPARETVVAQGDASDELFVVVEGHLKTSICNAAGDEVVLSILGPEEVFGEIALLDGEPRSASVSALEPCDLLVIQRGPFHALLREVPDLAFGMMAMLAKRIRTLTELTQDVSLLDVPKRLAKTLVALGDRFGEPSSLGEVKVTPRLSQHELGMMIGATREMVNRCLRDWVRQEVVEITERQIVIKNRDALCELAERDDDDDDDDE
jgi:CRP/FNR family transcriptional regulator, cyclic AMP receptor protein